MKTKKDCLLVLHRLGVGPGDTVLIHDHPLLKDCVNQSATFIEALLDCVGEEGTICTYQNLEMNQDPSKDEQIDFVDKNKVRQEMIEFDFKRYRDIFYNQTFLALSKVNNRLFNTHPRVVVCAVGKYSKLLTKGQPIDFPYGLQSTFESLRQLNAKVIYFNEDYQVADELRLAYTPSLQTIVTEGCVLGNHWIKYNDYKLDRNKYHKTIEEIGKKEVVMNNKKIQSVNYQQALNQFSFNHDELFISQK